MDNEINNEVFIVSLDKTIYHAIYEIRYRLSKRPDKKKMVAKLQKVHFGKDWKTGGVSFTEYVDSGVGTNDNLFVMVAITGTGTDSDCHQLIATLRETIFLLKDELRNKQVTIDNLIDVIKNFTVIENKYTRNKEQDTNVSSKEKNDVVGELLEIDELHHRFQKLTDQPQSSTDTHTSSINVNKDRIEQNRDGLELTNNVKVS